MIIPVSWAPTRPPQLAVPCVFRARLLKAVKPVTTTLSTSVFRDFKEYLFGHTGSYLWLMGSKSPTRNQLEIWVPN